MRLFFAVRPPEAVRVRLWRALAPLREALPEVRWVPRERYHITLRFLGDVGNHLVPRLAAASDELASEPAFRATLAGTGAFPPRGAPRVYWVGLRADPLRRLRERLDAALAGHGFPGGDRRFAPHLTIGRAKLGGGGRRGGRPSRRGPLADVGDISGAFVVRAVHLVRSELFPTGPKYTNVHEVALSNGGQPDIPPTWPES